MCDKKKDRAANFSSNEIDLCDLIIKYSKMIECKKTDATTWKEKEEEWCKLTTEFNNLNSGYPRTMKSLKTKYEGIKKELRKKAARHKLEIFKTGGGTELHTIGTLSYSVRPSVHYFYIILQIFITIFNDRKYIYIKICHFIIDTNSESTFCLLKCNKLRLEVLSVYIFSRTMSTQSLLFCLASVICKINRRLVYVVVRSKLSYW